MSPREEPETLTPASPASTDDGARTPDPPADHNDVHLVGRLSGEPRHRVLPSGDETLELRVVVRRPAGGQDTVPVQLGPTPPPGGRPKPGQVGRRRLAQARRLAAGDRIEVIGTLRRRGWDAGGVRRSRIEVAASKVERA